VVDPIDVVDTACNERVHLLQDRADISLPKFVAEQRLIAEAARPGTAACEFQFRASSRALENMVAVLVSLDVVVVELESTQLLHIGDAESWAQVHAGVIAPAATFDLRPGLGSQLRECLVWFAFHGDIAIQFSESDARSC